MSVRTDPDVSGHPIFDVLGASLLAGGAGDAVAGGAGAGLVTCVITARGSSTAIPDTIENELGILLGRRFAGVRWLQIAAEEFLGLPAWDGREGPRARLTIGPGALQLSRPDPAKRERTYERWLAGHMAQVDARAAWGDDVPDMPGRTRITEWSRRSRNRMTQTYCFLDYAPLLEQGLLSMVTLTYPGDWLTVAPNGKAVKRHLRLLLLRFSRAWGYSVQSPVTGRWRWVGRKLIGLWKLEFQRRGAPHVHILMAPPVGLARKAHHAETGLPVAGSGKRWKQWVSEVWADIVDHPDPLQRLLHEDAGVRTDDAEGLRMTDPKRIAVYFTKHGLFSAKEYQNVVPEEWQEPGAGPGRFWGVWGLQKACSVAELHEGDAIAAARTLRRWARAQGTTREVRVPRQRGGRPLAASWDVIGLSGAYLVEGARPGPRRRLRRRVHRLAGGTGWVSVNNGPAFAMELARYLASRNAFSVIGATRVAKSMPAPKPVWLGRGALLPGGQRIPSPRKNLVKEPCVPEVAQLDLPYGQEVSGTNGNPGTRVRSRGKVRR